ncbi:hypothetical protein CASFOL_026506 [Castilleja foliolosa]|uniref:KIB1-4 beta-propeller domain-containing protein n=1 Tax=Castilleja foliolosa TaxID=1961234 RepID=A0ABD3CJ66_9LAMI
MAFSSSVTLPLICPKGKIGFSSNNYCMLGKLSSRSCASSFNRRDLRTARATAMTAIEAVPKQESSPWLMLPPEIEAGKTSYKLYSLADDKVETLCPSDEIRDLRLTCRGSSHGWLALLSQHDDGFFLYNPISRRHIKLPSILNLPTYLCYHYKGILSSPLSVKKVILSCSPDEDEDNCRVVIVRDCGNQLAFCCPGRSKDWTLMFDENRDSYKDCVYSTKLKLFFVINFNIYGRRLETWDLGDISSPKLIKVDEFNYFTTIQSFLPYECLRIEKFLRRKCVHIKHLVVVDEDLLLVIQYIMFGVGPDGSHYEQLDERRPDRCGYMTIGFDIFKYDDSEIGNFKYLDRSSLGDLAIFVGKHSHSVAIQATQFPGVKPNSIYFTDGCYTGSLEGDESDDEYDHDHFCGGGGHDIGIYNYQDKTVSPCCYYPCDVQSLKTILPAPIWFFPN